MPAVVPGGRGSGSRLARRIRERNGYSLRRPDRLGVSYTLAIREIDSYLGIVFKLYAAVDQGPRSRHLQDLLELGPDRDELLAAARWTVTHDPSPGYRSLLIETLRQLGVEDADGWLD